MVTTKNKYGLSLCLSAAFCVLLTPMLFLIHADCYGTHSPSSGSLIEQASLGGVAGYQRPHSGSAHDPNDCVICQAFLQYTSGVTFGQACKVVPAHSESSVCAASVSSPDENRFSPFLSRAPPLPFDFFRS